MSKHTSAVLMLIGAALLWSSGGLFIKTTDLSALTIAGMRSAIAAITMLVWLKKPKPLWTSAQVLGVVSYTLTVVLFVIATKITTSAQAILLQYTAPVWVALLGWLFIKERLLNIDYLVVVLVLVGIGVLFLDTSSNGSMNGNLIAVASGVCFAGVAMCMRAQKGVSTVETILLGNILSAVVCLPLGGAFEVTFDIAWRMALLGIFQLGVSYILYATAVKYVTAFEAVLYTTLEPILNPVWVALASDEVPSLFTFAGGALVIGSVLMRAMVVSRRTSLSIEP